MIHRCGFASQATGWGEALCLRCLLKASSQSKCSDSRNIIFTDALPCQGRKWNLQHCLAQLLHLVDQQEWLGARALPGQNNISVVIMSKSLPELQRWPAFKSFWWCRTSLQLWIYAETPTTMLRAMSLSNWYSFKSSLCQPQGAQHWDVPSNWYFISWKFLYIWLCAISECAINQGDWPDTSDLVSHDTG